MHELSAWGPHFFFRRITSANAFGGVIDQEGPPGPGLCFRQSQWSARSEQMTGIVMVHEAAEAAVYPFCGSDFPRPESSVGHHSNKFPFSFPNVDTVFSLATGPLKLKFRIPNQRRYRIGFLEFPLKVKWKIKEPNRGFNEQNRSSESHGQGAKWFLISNEAKHHKFKDAYLYINVENLKSHRAFQKYMYFSIPFQWKTKRTPNACTKNNWQSQESFVNADYLGGEQISQDKSHIATIKKKKNLSNILKTGNLIQNSF